VGLVIRRLVAAILGAFIGVSVSAPLPVWAGLRITPSISLSERYDSNVLFSSSGGNEDLVTFVSPAVSARYTGRPLDATLNGSLSIGSYAKNSNFNYAAATGTLNVDLTQLVGRIDKRARLQISDNIFYTPELPAFVSATAGFNPFATGIQPQRVRSFSNIASASGGFAVTPRVDLSAGYGYSYLDFGSTVGAPAQAALFRTTQHTFNAGPAIKVTPTDTVTLQYRYQKVDYGKEVAGFQTQGGTAGLTHTFSPKVTGTVSVGATKITPSNRIAPLINLSVSWAERNTTTTLSYIRSVSPSFLVAASALESNLVALSVFQGLTPSLSAVVDVNYAHNTSATPGTDLLFESYGTNLTLNYSITRSFSVTFTYSHSDFRQGSSDLPFTFDRDVVGLSFNASWM
jgi:hypothetical protein